MMAREVFAQNKLMTLISESYWSTLNSGCLHGPPCFFSYFPCCSASRKPIRSVEFKFVARQVEASVVIRATKLKFVAESRTRIYFAQHVASTCSIVFCCETSWSKRGNTRNRGFQLAMQQCCETS